MGDYRGDEMRITYSNILFITFFIGIFFIGNCSATISWAYLDTNSLAHISTEYYEAESTPDGTLDIHDLNGSLLIKNSPLFIGAYDSNNVNSNINYLNQWTYEKDYIGFWKKSKQKTIGNNHSLRIKDIYWPLEKIASSHLIPVSYDNHYSINGSLYIEKDVFFFYKGGEGKSYSVGIYWFDESGNVIRKDEHFIYGTQGSWNDFSFDQYTPPFAKTMKIKLRHLRGAMGVAYFDNINVVEKKKTVYQGIQIKDISNASFAVNGDAAIYSLNQSSPDMEIELKYIFNRKTPFIEYNITINYHENLTTDFEKLVFDINSNSGQVLGKDYNNIRLSPLQIYKSDQWTPKAVTFHIDAGNISFMGSDDLQSMRLISGKSSSHLEFYLDDENNHPHPYFINGHIFDLDKSKRYAGDMESNRIMFSVNSDNDGNIVKMRQPYGYLATIIFTEHADGENIKKSRAIAFGSSDPTSPLYKKKGFVDNGLRWTKSVFIIDEENHIADALKEKSEYMQLIDDLYLNGLEIVPHSISPSSDNRIVVQENLALIRKYNSINWIDHGALAGTDNFEDLASQGWNKSSEYYILDILDAYGYKYAWGYIDYQVSGLNLLEPEKPEIINPYLYYNNNVDDNTSDSKRIYLWNSINTQKQPEKYYTRNNIDELIQEKGISIGHEYFSWEDCEGHCYFSISKQGGIEYEISKNFNNELVYISKKVKSGDLWNPTLAQFADYQIDAFNVDVIPLKDNKYLIKNNNNHAINGMSFLTNIKGIKSIIIDNGTVPYREVDDLIIFWFNISKKSEKIVDIVN